MRKAHENRRKLLLTALGTLAAPFSTGDAGAQDAAKIMPRAYRVALENDRVRVLEFTGRPGMGVCGESVHSHPAHLTIVLDQFHAKITLPDGKIVNSTRKVGDVFWSEAETHKVENVGRTGSRVMLVELKAPTAKKA